MGASSMKKYIITWAQNATPVHKGFFDSLETYAKHNKAEIVVIPGRYKNPTSHWSKKAESEDWWDERILPYLCANRRKLCKNLEVHGDIRVSPTATRPLTGFESYSGTSSAIFGHPKIQFQTIPRAAALPRIFTTTGACTKPNYTDSKAGKKGELHHITGACVVEVTSKGTYHIRQVNADKSGKFTDMDFEYSGTTATTAKQAAGLVLGDLHLSSMSTDRFKTLIEMCKELDPRNIVVHDALDFSGRSHHSAHLWHKRCREGVLGSVEYELHITCERLAQLQQVAPVYVVPSNHDAHLDQWLQKFPDNDPKNIPIWVKMWNEYFSGDKRPAFVRAASKTGATFGKVDESYAIRGIECGYHGDRGINGSRGGIMQFAKLGARTVTGHAHSPAILHGAYQVGTSSPLKLGYNSGPSGWLNTHCIIYDTGKRTLLTQIDGKHRG